MAESELPSADRGATWTAVKTFRQRPTVVGRTATGETIYEIRSVRMLFPAGSTHFKRLVQCAKCGRDMVGSSMLAAEDLDRQPNAVFCATCSRSAPAGVDMPAHTAPTPARTERPAPEDGRRVAAVESRLAEVTRRLDSPPAVDPEVASLSAAVAELQGEVQKAARLDAGPGMVAMMEAHRRELHAALADGQQVLRAEISALEAQARDQAAAFTQLLEAQRQELERALDDRVQRSLGVVAEPLQEVTEQQRVLEERLSETSADTRALLTDRVETAVAAVQRELRAELAALEAHAREQAMSFSQLLDDQRPVEEVAAVEQLVQTLRHDVERALEDVVHRTLAAVAAPLEEVTTRQRALEEQLSETRTDGRALEQLRAEVASLAQAVKLVPFQAAQEALEAVADPLRDLTRAREEYERRLEALATSVDAGASRHHRLEQQLHALVEAGAEVESAAPRHAPGHILEALDRQLRAAEERLAQR